MADDAVSAVGEPAGLGGGVALEGDDGSVWVLLGDAPGSVVERGLGGALAWAVRRNCTALRLLTDADAGVLARRALSLRLPVTVLHVDGRSMTPASPTALPTLVPVSERHREFVGLIREGGAEPVEEHGVLVGEVEGLEVCRVVDDSNTGEVRLDVGIGAHDRETFQLLHGDRPKVEALAGVVESVRSHRGAIGTSSTHPLRHLAASRLVRARLVADPSPIGTGPLVGVDPPLVRTNLKDEVPCVAREIGTSRIVVCTTGIDLEVVPWAADAIAACAATECLIAAPERDVIDIQERLAAMLVVPTRFVPVPRAAL
jgi:hypothetical protein